MTLIELRDALRKATHGTFALECEIGRLIDGWTGQYGPPRNYTVSLDAAVTLVPPEFSNHWGVHCVGPDCLGSVGNTEAGGRTPALALCLARVEHEIVKAGLQVPDPLTD